MADNTAPTGTSITPPSGSNPSTTASVAFTTGTDAGSGIGTRLLQRASIAQANGVCPTSGYSAFTTIFTNPGSSPVSDAVVLGKCYKYQYVVSDRVGNTTTASSGNVLGQHCFGRGELQRQRLAPRRIHAPLGGGSNVLYIDGASKSATGLRTVPTTSTWNLAESTYTAFVGTLDEVAVYTTALSASDVAAHYAAR